MDLEFTPGFPTAIGGLLDYSRGVAIGGLLAVEALGQKETMPNFSGCTVGAEWGRPGADGVIGMQIIDMVAMGAVLAVLGVGTEAVGWWW